MNEYKITTINVDYCEFHVWREKIIKKLIMNDAIQSKEVRLVSESGQQVLPTIQALNMAIERGLDLIQITESDPPVCKILDAGKYKYELQKKEKQNKQNQKTIETKEIRMSITIDENDFQTKVRSAESFLTKGYYVKVSVRFRGREITHIKIGEEILTNFCQEVSHLVTSKTNATLQGNMLSILLKP
ncbi:translation initiation factor IF-3 [Neobacillus cucumis]|uniref:translation initiation factor IF-3 n=1 Tax=Neobacillus cucumis TaxID=1740721 RepID=UPI001962E959|nr:translation initiation factor IF-3 [Neobacillus cucumis]MBM7652217.1 translation initiation factor IF-3 [Neobacillus cucumis]